MIAHIMNKMVNKDNKQKVKPVINVATYYQCPPRTTKNMSKLVK